MYLHNKGELKMKKNILGAVLLFSVSAGAAQASLTFSGTHDAAANQLETYFFQATTGGATNIFISSLETVIDGTSYPMDSILSVWQQNGTNWSLVGANHNAPFSSLTGVNTFGAAVHQWVITDPLAGLSDPGLNLNLTSGANYLLINSNNAAGPSSLIEGTDGVLTGSLGQTIAVGSNLLAALTPDTLGFANTGIQVNPYSLTVAGNAPSPPAVPLPAAVWLFGTVLAGFGVFGRKKTAHQLVA